MKKLSNLVMIGLCTLSLVVDAKEAAPTKLNCTVNASGDDYGPFTKEVAKVSIPMSAMAPGLPATPIYQDRRIYIGCEFFDWDQPNAFLCRIGHKDTYFRELESHTSGKVSVSSPELDMSLTDEVRGQSGSYASFDLNCKLE